MIAVSDLFIGVLVGEAVVAVPLAVICMATWLGRQYGP